MLKKLKLTNFIKHKDVEFTFEKGITGIRGRNGAGKSLLFEAIRFALFGTSALRSVVSDYPKNMKVELELSIKGEDYKIVRTLSDCKFGDIIGTKACNKAIAETLGYGLTVFDMGNCAKQDEIHRLGDMRPSERKQAVDKVIGIDLVDKLIKELNEVVSQNKGKIELLSMAVLDPPCTPEMPFGYEKSDVLMEKLNKTRELNTKVAVAEAKASVQPVLPSPPPEFNMVEPTGDPSTEVEYMNLVSEMSRLSTVTGSSYGDNDYLDEQLTLCKAYCDRDKLEQPQMTRREIEDEKEKWRRYYEYVGQHTVVCPNCSCEFNPHEGKQVEKVEKPGVDERTLATQERLWKALDELPEYTETPTLRLSEAEFRNEMSKNLEYLNAKKRLGEIGTRLGEIGVVDYDAWRKYRAEKQANDALRSAYTHGLEKYAEDVKAVELAKAELEELKKALVSMPSVERLNELYGFALSYEMNMIAYEREVLERETKKKHLEEVQKVYESHKLAVEGLKNFKAKVKSYITPSLSKVAGELIREMTDGVMGEVAIDDDFNITLEGKNLNVFSGSEKAVANLALRIGLGRVLTHSAFNVFMGDEIDADCDFERASKIAESLRRLSGQIDQIILISHRGITADNYIEV